MHKDVLEFLLNKELQNIKNVSKKKVRKLAATGISSQEIVDQTVQNHFSETEILKEIDRYNYYYKKISPAQSMGYLLLGLLGMGSGIMLFFYRPFLSIIVLSFGATTFKKAFSSKADIDYLNQKR